MFFLFYFFVSVHAITKAVFFLEKDPEKNVILIAQPFSSSFFKVKKDSFIYTGLSFEMQLLKMNKILKEKKISYQAVEVFCPFEANGDQIMIANRIFSSFPCSVKLVLPEKKDLQEWIEKNDKAQFFFFLKDQSRLFFCDERGRGPLHWIAEKGDVFMGIFILKMFPHLLHEKDKEGWSALSIAILAKKSSFIQFLLEKSPHALCEKNYQGQRTLDLTVDFMSRVIISSCQKKLSLEQDPSSFSVDCFELEEDHLLFFEFQLRFPEVARAFFYNAPLSAPLSSEVKSYPLLHFALRYHAVKTAVSLIGQDSSLLGKKDAGGNTVLHLAVQEKNFPLIDLLCQCAFFLIYEKNNEEHTVLDCAILQADLMLVKFFLSLEKNLVYRLNKKQMSVIHYAVMSKNREILEALLPMSIELVNSKNKDGQTPLDFCEQGSAMFVTLKEACQKRQIFLRYRGFSVNESDAQF
jgi:ankyrin repeat protein